MASASEAADFLARHSRNLMERASDLAQRATPAVEGAVGQAKDFVSGLRSAPTQPMSGAGPEFSEFGAKPPPNPLDEYGPARGNASAAPKAETIRTATKAEQAAAKAGGLRGASNFLRAAPALAVSAGTLADALDSGTTQNDFDMSQRIVDAMPSGMDRYKKFAEANPNAANVIDSTMSSVVALPRHVLNSAGAKIGDAVYGGINDIAKGQQIGTTVAADPRNAPAPAPAASVPTVPGLNAPIDPTSRSQPVPEGAGAFRNNRTGAVTQLRSQPVVGTGPNPAAYAPTQYNHRQAGGGGPFDFMIGAMKASAEDAARVGNQNSGLRQQVANANIARANFDANATAARLNMDERKFSSDRERQAAEESAKAVSNFGKSISVKGPDGKVTVDHEAPFANAVDFTLANMKTPDGKTGRKLSSMTPDEHRDMQLAYRIKQKVDANPGFFGFNQASNNLLDYLPVPGGKDEKGLLGTTYQLRGGSKPFSKDVIGGTRNFFSPNDKADVDISRAMEDYAKSKK